jgi:hypothetical protein
MRFRKALCQVLIDNKSNCMLPIGLLEEQDI